MPPQSEKPFELRLLGRLRLTGPSGEELGLPTRKTRMVLAYLAAREPGGFTALVEQAQAALK